jgi:double-GTPase-like protein
MSDSNCTHEGCQVSSSGKCLEGFEPIDECPYLSRTAGQRTGEADSDTSGAFVALPHGNALTENEAAEVTRRAPTQVVVLAGPVESGKTTILVSIFESLLDAPIGNFLFAGSQTLVAFERRAHDARITSTREFPTTAHTLPREGIVFLHLRLAATGGKEKIRRDLLLSDISGETFKQIRDSSRAAMDLNALRRADHLCLVVDGAKLADTEQRHAARNDARSILRSILEAKMLSRGCKIEVVFSKWDLVELASDSAQIKSYVNETREALSHLAAGNGRELQFYEVAARPETKLLPFAHGVPTLLRAWFGPGRGEVMNQSRVYLTRAQDGDREISRFSETVADTDRLGGSYDVC